MLESAVFYLAADKADFSDKETYRDKIMSAANISDENMRLPPLLHEDLHKMTSSKRFLL